MIIHSAPLYSSIELSIGPLKFKCIISSCGLCSKNLCLTLENTFTLSNILIAAAQLADLIVDYLVLVVIIFGVGVQSNGLTPCN